MAASKKEKVPRESFLARDSAMSAFFSSFSDSSPSPGAIAMPMLAPMTTEWPSSRSGEENGASNHRTDGQQIRRRVSPTRALRCQQLESGQGHSKVPL